MKRLLVALLCAIFPLGIYAQTTIFYEDFEETAAEVYSTDTTALTGAPEWDYENTLTGEGRLRLNAGAEFARSGSHAATMDRDPNGAVQINYLILNLDLSAYDVSEVILLNFSYMNHGEESNPNDSVWVRGSNSDPWVGLYDLFANMASPGDYKTATEQNISSALAGVGQNFSTTFQIRFGQEDNFPATTTSASDGFTFDDIHLYYPSVIFSEDFESFTVPSTLQNGWVNELGDDMDWSVNAGPTVSTGTGPDVDFTSGTSAGKYMYLEASSNFNKTALFTSPFVDVSVHDEVLLEFYYHMYGVAMGKLLIEVSTGTTWSTVGYISGEKHLDELAPWFRKRIVLPSNADSVQIRFRGMTGAAFTSDLSIDNIKMYGYSEVLTGRYTYGGSSDEVGEDIIQTADGGFITTGYSKSFGGGREIYLVRSDARGMKIWSKTYGGINADEAFEVVTTKDGGIAITGRTATYGSGSISDAFLLKTDISGNVTWMKTYGNADTEYGRSLQETSDGGFIIGGYRNIGGQNKFYLIRTDDLGDTSWTQTMDAGNKEKVFSVEQVRDGGFIIMGWRSNTFEAYMIKVDASGVIQWANGFDGPNAESWNDMVQSPDNGYYVIGGTTSYGQGNSDIHLAKIDETGNILWTKVYGGFGWDSGGNIQLTNDDNLIIVGRDGSFGVGAGDSFMMKVDLLGNVIWSKTYGGTGSDWANSVVPCIDGGYALTGFTESFGSGGKDLFLIKTDQFGNITCNSTPAAMISNVSPIPIASRTPTTVSGSATSSPVPGDSDPGNDMTEVCALSSNEELDTITFQIAIGSLQNDETGFKDFSESSVLQTSDGGYAMVGTSAGFGTGGKDYYLSKFDRLGSLEWSKAYGGSDIEWAYSVRQTGDNGFVIAGRSKSFSSGDDDMYVVRTDELGDTLWTKTYGGSSNDRAHSIQETNDDGFVIVGYTNSFGNGMFIVKTDDIGDTLWTKSIIVGTTSQAHSVEQTTDGGFIVGGYSDLCADKTPILVKLSSGGTIEWIKSYQGNCSAGIVDICYVVHQTNDGGYILAGEAESYGSGGIDGYLIKTDETGDTLWTKTFGTTGTDRLHDVVQDPDGGYVVSGHSNGFGSSYDMFLTKTNSAGAILWSKIYGGSSNDRGYSLDASSDGGYVISGYTESFDIGNGDLYLVKTDELGVPGNCFYSAVTPTVLSAGLTTIVPAFTVAYGNTSVNPTADVDNATSIISQLDLQSSMAIIEVGCNGGSDASVDLMLNGGTEPITYLWSSGATTQDLTNVVADTFTVAVTDAFGCTVNDTAIVTEPELLTTGISKIDISCFGGNDGTASAIPSGGTPPYNYLWNTGQTDSTAIGLFPGNYSVNVFDLNGCLANNIISITEPLALATSITGTDVNCVGGATGLADQTVTGGTTPYTYLWSNTATTEDISSVIAGTYSVTITDSCGITAIDSVIINEPPSLSTSIIATGITCNGFGDGTADLSVSGGTLPYTYAWSNFENTEDISGLAQGNFIITVTDGCAITIIDTAVINEPAILTTTISKTDATCFSGGDGTATVTPSGGTAPYNYLWNIGQTDSTAIGLFAGTYGVNIVDANGCLASNTIIVNQPGALSIGLTGTPVTCNGGSDGTANPNASGGTTPYTYAWSNSAVTAVLTGISAGVYTVTVTDACNAVLVDSVSISEPSTITSTITISNISCNGSTDGNVDLTVSGGTQPYTYSWSSGPTTEDLSNLDTGTFIVTITDACTATLTDTAIISEPQVLTTSMTSTDVECFGGGNGTATVTTTGGIAPYNYLWNNGQTNSTSIGLFPNNYTVNVTDSNGCLTSDIVSIAQPIQLSATFASTDVSCLVGNNGTGTATPFGGTLPYSYIWSTSGDTTAVSSGLVEGTYAVTVTDSCGATIIDSVVIGGPGSLSTLIIGSDVSCFGFGDGSLTLTVSSGSSPYAYAWSNGDTTKDISGLSIGMYSVTVTDSCGTIITDSLLITEPTLLTSTISGTNINCNGNGDGTATVSASGGTTPYFYQWNNNQTVPAMIGLFQGNYTVNVTDANGCLTSNNIAISEPPALVQSISIFDASCGNADGSASSIASGGVTPYTYAWSSGGSSSTDSLLTGGGYSIVLTDNNGCIDSAAVTIPVSAVPQDICMITVDSTSSMNVVVWEKASVTNIDSFKVYRDIIGVYAYIGSLPYGAESNFYDSTSGINPNITSYRYKISTLDVCGNESILSDYHETIHVQTNKTGGVVDMSWDNYEGFGFAYYRILRDSTGLGGANWAPFDSVTSNNFTYTDINPPNATTNYAIEVVHSNGCVANKQKNWNSSKSNTSTTIGIGGSITATTSSTNASFGGCDGTATVTPTSGTPTYTYLWDGSTGFQNTPTAAGLCPGNYAVTVTDALGAKFSTSVAVGEDSGTGLSASTSSTSSSSDTCNGSANVTAVGGFNPYTYLWDGNAGNQTTASITGLCPGTYSVVVTDSAGNQVTVFATVGVFPGMVDIVGKSIEFKAYPNPFVESTTVSYVLREDHLVHLELFNVLGELISIVASDNQIKGEYSYQINASALNLSPGVYGIRLTLDNKTIFSKQLIR